MEACKEVYIRQTDSTMNRAREEAEAADRATDLFVVRTDHQESGRGRSGALWQDIPGHSVLITVAVRRSSIWDPRDPVAATMALRAAAAVSRAIETHCSPPPSAGLAIKWPNDILIGDGKACGILVEATSQWFFVGIGLNLITGKLKPDPTTDQLSSPPPYVPVGVYGDQPPGASPAMWTRWIVESLTSALRGDWWHQFVQDRLKWKGEAVCVLNTEGQREVDGILLGLSKTGALMIRDPQSNSVYPPVYVGTLRRNNC